MEKYNDYDDSDIPGGETNPEFDSEENTNVEGYYAFLFSKSTPLKSIIVARVLKDFLTGGFEDAIAYLMESEERREKMKKWKSLTDEQFSLLDRVLRDKDQDPEYFEAFLEVLDVLNDLN